MNCGYRLFPPSYCVDGSIKPFWRSFQQSAAMATLARYAGLALLVIYALLAVAGVVVNDSLVLVERIQQGAASEEHRLSALLQAGQARFRPILLTTLTTFLGLMPILWEQGAEAERVIPMAATLAFGVLFSTLVTLVLVPVGYLVFADIRRVIKAPG